MTRKTTAGAWALFGSAVLIGAAGCGGWFGGGGGGKSCEVFGNISDVNPADSGRDIVVFVFRVNDQPADCTTPELPDPKKTTYESEELKDGAVDFDIKKSKTGRLVVAFLLDNAGKDADGRIDPGDPVAVLDDPDCLLDDVPNKYVIEADDIRVNFGLDQPVGMPAPGRAEANPLKEYPKSQKP